MAMIADGWNMHGDMGTGGWVVMALVMILFWGAIIALIVWAVRSGTQTRSGGDPRTILDRRLAAGEITIEEYEQRRSILDGTRPST